MARHYGIPYMGSKQKLVDKIVPFILNRHPGVDSFYDLFGGGGSVSLYVVRKYPHLDVVYNERSKAIGNLVKHIRDNGEIPFDFVDRSEFTKKYTGDDWYAGLLQTCWSFGNNGEKGYMYAKHKEDFKRELSMLVTTGTADIDWLERTADDLNKKEYGKDVSTRLFLNPKRYTTPYQRRIVLARQITNLGVMQHIARLERLVQIQNMPGVSTLGISVGTSYDEVPILGKQPILYCDPPYESTAEYRESDFDHKAFYDWCMAQTVPVYVSSYKVSDPRFKRVKAIKTRSLLAKKTHANYMTNHENIYWNGVS